MQHPVPTSPMTGRTKLLLAGVAIAALALTIAVVRGRAYEDPEARYEQEEPLGGEAMPVQVLDDAEARKAVMREMGKRGAKKRWAAKEAAAL